MLVFGNYFSVWWFKYYENKLLWVELRNDIVFGKGKLNGGNIFRWVIDCLIKV